MVTNSPAYGTLQGSLLVSSERWGIGFSIGVVVAVIIAVLSGLSRIGEYALDPVMNALRSVPLLGLLPLFIVWFGIGDLPKDLIVLLGALFPMYINTFAGIRGVDPKLGELGQVLGLSRRELVWQVVLPGALPQALTGMRLSVIGSLIALVVGEQINANAGLGFMMNQAETFLAEQRHRGGPARVRDARRDRGLGGQAHGEKGAGMAAGVHPSSQLRTRRPRSGPSGRPACGVGAGLTSVWARAVLDGAGPGYQGG